MPKPPQTLCLCLTAMATTLATPAALAETPHQAAAWRAEHRIIDLHQHLEYTPALLARAIRVMDAAGVGLGVDLTPGFVTRGTDGETSEFERNKKLADSLYPGRWVHYMYLDFAHWNQPDFAAQAVRQVEEGHRLGAAGYKEAKRFGLGLTDGAGKRIAIDDPKLDPMWERLGELDMPVSIHVGDPKAFFEPYDEHNERWAELKDHRSWWYGDSTKFPRFHELLEALSRVIGKHPKTTFVCVHFGNNAEELEWVDAQLDQHPNMRVDLAARIPELGRHDPAKVRALFIKHQDRILFGTDFQSLEQKMILGSSGNEPPPSEADAGVFFLKQYRWLETLDENWEHMTPIQGNWKISSIGLPAPVLRKIYFDNARKLLARSLPAPILKARCTTRDFAPDGDLSKELWQTAQPVTIDSQTRTAEARPELSTTVRALWSADFLYLAYECPFTELTVFEPPLESGKRGDFNNDSASLWGRDVVEAFIAGDPKNPERYAEFEVAPTNERLDLMIAPAKNDLNWNSGFTSGVRVNQGTKTWTCEMRLPLKSLDATVPKIGLRLPLNLFRCDRAHQAALAWRPSLSGTFHVPQRFGFLEFVE